MGRCSYAGGRGKQQGQQQPDTPQSSAAGIQQAITHCIQNNHAAWHASGDNGSHVSILQHTKHSVLVARPRGHPYFKAEQAVAAAKSRQVQLC
jgi:uncharacterized protein (DUF2461 family)